MQPVELLIEEEIWPYDLPIELIKEPTEPVRFGCLYSAYHKDSPFQSIISVFYAKVKLKGEWIYLGARNTWSKKYMTLLQVYHLIKSDVFKTETDTLQAIEDDKEAKKFKAKHFCYATFSGKFFKRNEDDILNHSRLICIDLDKLGGELYWIRETVNRDPLTLMSFISPSGTGLKVIYQIDPGKHSQATYYQYLSEYLSKLCSLPKQSIDESCKDVSRACFLPCDPSAYLNLDLV
ncbi:hypothetical protein GXP67_21130 [Rhodocytophaga rosea]|uniref:BT4734-like N-terminal domain-containing protein n=1 Tax=Rhodocytophaga rosea TaxID=2704465 RepID=A0A6C0GMC5_9BACT|nr:BT4734/BF3469 family protein [Rhodocytophaga rosea]QHT68974.1 hypothetical protein GXP67_21130 [Rhodocytophaga rosea]